MGRLPKLEPLATSGDGNCLLHAASLYMWGLHDHSLVLRTALHRLLTKGVEREGVKRRWRYQTQLRNDEAGGLTFTEEEWEFEWGEILRIATNKPRRQPITDSLRRHSSLRLSYESLEEIHISVLAHTLRRPIIVISDRTIKDMSGQDLAPIYFGGIYLPLEVNPTACHKSPIVLAYDSSHFSPLVAIQESSTNVSEQQKPRVKYARMSSRSKEAIIPLVSPDGALLPVQFIYDPDKKNVQEKWSKMEYGVGEFPDEIVRLLESYMNVRWIQLKVAASDALRSSSSSTEDYDHLFPVQVPKVRFPAASIAQESQPIYQKELVEKYLVHIREKFQEEKEAKARREAQREEEEKKRQQNKIVPCEGEGCDMFGRPATNNLCSVCYQKARLAAEWEGEDARLAETSPTEAEQPPEYASDFRNTDAAATITAQAHSGQPGSRGGRHVSFEPPPLHDQLDSGREREHVFGRSGSDSSGESPVFTDSAGRDITDSGRTVPTQQQSQFKSTAPLMAKQPLVPAAKQALAPVQTNVQRSTSPPAIPPHRNQPAAPKQPLLPAKHLVHTNAHREGSNSAPAAGQRGRTPDENRATSRSPTPPNGPSPSHRQSKSPPPPAVPPKSLDGSPARATPPTSLGATAKPTPPTNLSSPSRATPPKTLSSPSQPITTSSPSKPTQPQSLGTTSKTVTPSSPSKAPTAASPVKSKGGSPSRSRKAGAASQTPAKSSSTNWVSNLFKKKPQQQTKGYSRDNILPLHLETAPAAGGTSTDPETLAKMGVASSGSSEVCVKEVKKRCKTSGCEFYGSPGNAGYCSSCYEVISRVTDVNKVSEV